MINKYLQITKPGIIFGNLLSIIGGFLLAAHGNVDYTLFLSTILGVSLAIASGCIVNNYIDRDIDKIMERTKNRVLVKGLIDPKTSLVYAAILGIIGIVLIFFMTNILAGILTVIGLVIYVVIYSLYMKRQSVHSTLVGSISGAIPPVIGYCAVTDKFDTTAFILFCIFCIWQIPHSYAIAIFNIKDYRAANIPTFPIIKGISVTKKHITLYILAFMIASLILYFSGYTGYTYCIVIGSVSLLWLLVALYGYQEIDENRWARKIFLFSIIAIFSLSIMLSINFINFLP